MSFLLPLAIVVAAGLALGQIKVRGIGLGVAGVLFAGLAFGHFAAHVDVVGHWVAAPEAHTLDVVRDLGLVLFVYGVGAQVGPGFLASLKDGGFLLSGLAAAVVGGGVVVAVVLAQAFHVDMAAMVGVLCGATTNTPSLGAAQQAVDGLGAHVDEARRGSLGLGYAAAYPLGVAGVIASIAIVRAVFRVDVRGEAAAAEARLRAASPALVRRAFVVENANLDGLRVADVPGLAELGVVISRRAAGASGVIERAGPHVVLALGDVVLAVGTDDALVKAGVIIGSPSSRDLVAAAGGRVETGRLVVTRKDAVGSTLAALALDAHHDVTVTRVRRGDIDMIARPSLELRFGDLLNVVGAPADIAAAAGDVGNSQKALGVTDFLPIFVGIALGVIVGNIAIPVAGLPAPVKLGLAGGPLLVAIVLGRAGKIGPLVFHLPGTVNLALRELGIALFLAAVGMKSGAHLADAVAQGGLVWIACGAAITLIPLLTVASLARVVWKLDFARIAGLLAGSMTDPPALVFANAVVGNDAAAVAYAAAYPTTMVLRIVAAQALVLWALR